MKILVTGAAGFIAFHFIKDLLSKGINVVGVDNLNNYYDINLKKDRLHELISNKLFQFYEIDISNFQKLNSLFLKNNFDIVINLAAQAGVRYSLENPYAYYQSNILGFANLLEIARKNNISNIIYASSSSVYGNTPNIPFSETDKTIAPISVYATSKLVNELLASDYSRNFGIKAIGLRFFTVYGSFGRPDMAYYSFTERMRMSQPITVFNNGNMARDMTHISDIVSGIFQAIEYLLNIKQDSFNQIINLGNNKPVQLWDLIEIIKSRLNKDPEIIHKRAATEVDVTYADIQLAKKLLSYEPKISIEEGMIDFINWHKSYYEDINA